LACGAGRKRHHQAGQKSPQGPTPQAPLSRPPQPPQPPALVPKGQAAKAGPGAAWHPVAMNQGPAYSYAAIPQGWLLLAPSGDLLFLSDPTHEQPEAVQALGI